MTQKNEKNERKVTKGSQQCGPFVNHHLHGLVAYLHISTALARMLE